MIRHNRFCCEWCDSEISLDEVRAPSGWILKGPFTTNSQCIYFPTGLLDIKRDFYAFCMDIKFASIPYVILQPKLANRLVCIIIHVGIAIISLLCNIAGVQGGPV